MAGVLLRHFNPSVNCMDFKGRNAIWYTVGSCDEDLVQLLLDLQSNIWMTDYRRTTPLNLAISKRNLRITDMLLHYSRTCPSQRRLIEVNAEDHPLCLAV
jgi:ankyrin repeat protein